MKRAKIETPEQAIAFINSPEYEMSFSQLLRFMQSPRHLIRYLTGADDVGDAAKFSRLAHVYILEGAEKFHEKFIIVDGQVRPSSPNEKRFVEEMTNLERDDPDNYVEAFTASYSTSGKSEAKIFSDAKERLLKFRDWINLEREVAKTGKKMIVSSEFNLIKDLHQTTRDDLDMARLIDGASFIEKENSTTIEVAGQRKNDPPYKMKFKGRIDGGGKDSEGRYIFDLKILTDALTRKVMRKIVDDYIYVQSGIYSRMEKLKPEDRYFLLVLDKNLNSNIIEVMPAFIEAGVQKVKEQLLWFRFCKNVNGWKRSYNFFSDRGDGTYAAYPPYWMVPDQDGDK